MWRAGLVVAFLLVAHVHSAMASALCADAAFAPITTYSGTLTGADSIPRTGTWRLYETTPVNLDTMTLPAGVRVVTWERSATGAPCAESVSARPYVVVTRETYDAMLEAAEVVAKIQEQMDLGVVGLACVAALSGFYCGYKMVQRGSSQ